VEKKEINLFCPYIYDGGLEKTLEIYAIFLKKKFKVNIVTNSFNTKKLNRFKKKINIINFKNRFFYKYRLLNNIYCILKIFFLFKKPIIFSMQDHFFLCLLKLIKLDFKLIIRTQTAIINDANKSEKEHLKKKFLFRNLITIFYKYADLVITFSKENKKFLQKKIKVKKVSVIYNFFKKNKGKKYLKKKYNVFFVGRLTYDKNPDFFLTNCIELSKKIDFNIHIIGKGERFKSLIKKGRKYKNVKIYGYIEKGIEKYNKLIDIFCVTSKYDGTPNVLGEAMSYKIPCLAPKNVGLSNLLLSNGKYGYLYKPNSGVNFQNKLFEILKNYKTAIKKAEAGHISLNRFDKEKTLKKLEKIILRTL